MKIGSIVENIDPSLCDVLQMNTPYTIREILPLRSIVKSSSALILYIGEVGIRLEEINHTATDFGTTWPDAPFPIRCFRELQLPDEVAEILENELQLI